MNLYIIYISCCTPSYDLWCSTCSTSFPNLSQFGASLMEQCQISFHIISPQSDWRHMSLLLQFHPTCCFLRMVGYHMSLLLQFHPTCFMYENLNMTYTSIIYFDMPPLPFGIVAVWNQWRKEPCIPRPLQLQEMSGPFFKALQNLRCSIETN